MYEHIDPQQIRSRGEQPASCVVRPFNTILGLAAIKESIPSMKSMPAALTGTVKVTL